MRCINCEHTIFSGTRAVSAVSHLRKMLASQHQVSLCLPSSLRHQTITMQEFHAPSNITAISLRTSPRVLTHRNGRVKSAAAKEKKAQ